MYLGGLALETIIGIDLIKAVIGLALFAAAYSLYGGLSAVAWTDIIQVFFLVLGGLVTTYLALDTVSQGQGIIEGIKHIYHAAPDRFEMILDKSNPEYKNLPGIGVLVGGLWVANLYYWGFNQYIIQRTLAAKSLKESQKGILFAASLKLIPLIVVIPGISHMLLLMIQNIGVLVSGLNMPTMEKLTKLTMVNAVFTFRIERYRCCSFSSCYSIILSFYA